MFSRSSLLSARGFRHAFATRALDFSVQARAEDREAAVRRIAAAIETPEATFYRAVQVHGARVVSGEGDREAVAREEADALVAALPGHAVGVRVADCVAILAGDEESGAVAAIHAGWRGVVGGVVPASLEKLQGKSVVATICPCVGPCCFEVGADVAAQIAQAAGVDVVARRAGDKAFVDLRRAVRAQLRAAGVEQVDDIEGCTMCDAARFFSHRRDASASGRHMAAIAVSDRERSHARM